MTQLSAAALLMSTDSLQHSMEAENTDLCTVILSWRSGRDVYSCRISVEQLKATSIKYMPLYHPAHGTLWTVWSCHCSAGVHMLVQ